VTDGPRPLTGAIVARDATIDAAALRDLPPRSALGGIMGGSAAALSNIENSEWLHLIAHSLGGEDAPANIVAGPHSLNTAMIKFEVLVRNSVRLGKAVNYAVTFFASVEGQVNYVHHVEIRIAFQGGGERTWTLEVNRHRIGEFINGGVYDEIGAHLQGFS
jgi:hypothetical protein